VYIIKIYSLCVTIKLEVIIVKKNVGKIDKIVRYVIGVGLLIGALWVWWLAIPAVVALVTAALGTCGIYALLGINTTCKTE